MEKTQKNIKKASTGLKCSMARKCGGCQYINETYQKQLSIKEQYVKDQLKDICKVCQIEGMKDPYHYRNKVNAAFTHQKAGIISGIYQESTHKVVNIENCLLENETADSIINDIKGLMKSFKITAYNEKSGMGLLRHVMIRKGFETGEVLVVLVITSPIFPSKRNFVKALLKLHPEIKSVVLNINDRYTSMVLGERNIVLYGSGYIEDILCGLKFRISPNSFYQVNPVQTEKLYNKAISLAELTGKEKVIDAYCGIGTIGMSASHKAGEVLGIELNPLAVADAKANAKVNGINNIRFIKGDAGEVMTQMASNGEHADVLFMDPPRSGSDEAFLSSAVTLAPDRIIYISCNPQTLARDLKYLKKHGYKPVEAYPFDMFPWTKEEHVETVCRLVRV